MTTQNPDKPVRIHIYTLPLAKKPLEQLIQTITCNGEKINYQIQSDNIVLECVPDKVAEMITKELKIPTLGIGAGPMCDGQVLVIHDMLGLSQRSPTFAKRFVDVKELIAQGIKQFRDEVLNGTFPSKEYSFTIPDEEIKKLERGRM